jgi:DNA invertase Pin-like site-specific DNA recombinase
MRKAGVYVRISEDREGAGLGVKRQEADCRALAAQVGWGVADVYVDNDLSAYSGKPRPAYRRLLEDLGAGRIDAVLAWHADRLHRAPAELEEFIRICDSRGVEVRTVKAGELDLGTASGRMVARILGDVARHESEHKSERIRRKHLELAEAGKVVGGGTRPFGFEADRLTVRESEAELIREAARRVLAGDSLRGICADWNRRAVVTSTGGPWRQQVLRRLLMSGRIAGWREHRGVLVAPAVWPAIVDRATVDRLRARLGDPSRRTAGPEARRYLLSGGLLRCGPCGRPLRARPRVDHMRRYVCPSGPGYGGCGGIAIVAEPLEDLVVERVLDVLDSPVVEAQAQRLVEGTADVVVETLGADVRALEELALDYYRDRLISRDEYLVARASLEGRIESARRQLAESTGGRVLESVRGVARTRWPEVGFDQRRAILAAMIESITIGAGRRGFNRFDPGRLAIAWRA